MKRYYSLLVIAVAIALSSTPASAACIYGELANFDVHNFTNQPVNDFMLTLRGITCDDIEEFFFPELYDSIKCWEDENGTNIKWYFPPVEPCTWIHFGVSLRPGVPAPVVVFAALTFDCNPVAVIPFPWQAWEGTVECPVIDIIPGNETIPPEGVLIWRMAGFSPEVIPLDSLTVDNSMVEAIDWIYVDEIGQVLTPDGELTLELQTSGDPAALVVYRVEGMDGTQYMTFLSEAIIDYGPSGTEGSTWGRIKSLFK